MMTRIARPITRYDQVSACECFQNPTNNAMDTKYCREGAEKQKLASYIQRPVSGELACLFVIWI